jgi:acetyltransferase-like isoleucine patch superfamily enzyme
VEKGAIVGNRVTIKHHVSVFSGVTIEDEVFIGSNIAFINDRHPRSRQAEWTLEKTLIRKGASLGSNAVVMCGLTVGQYAVIGAGAVVTKDVPDHGLVVGNPAKLIGYACKCGKKLVADLTCTCGKKYKKNGLHLSEIA